MKKFIFFCFLSLFLANCNDRDDIDSVSIDCTEIACTEQFITLVVTVKDNSGVLIPLDRFEVIDQKTSENITTNITFDEFQMARQNGQYPLYNDSYVSENQNTKRTLVFSGFINDEKVVTSEYVVETDCCHVSITKGDPDISIN